MNTVTVEIISNSQQLINKHDVICYAIHQSHNTTWHLTWWHVCLKIFPSNYSTLFLQLLKSISVKPVNFSNV